MMEIKEFNHVLNRRIPYLIAAKKGNSKKKEMDATARYEESEGKPISLKKNEKANINKKGTEKNVQLRQLDEESKKKEMHSKHWLIESR